MIVPRLTLSNGVTIPAMGLGTYPMHDEATAAVASGLELGYRLIDTAEAYGNEEQVGRGIAASRVPRDQIFITTKFNRAWHSVDGVRQAAQASMRRLGVDYLDMLLIHWPNPGLGRYVEAFEGLLRLLDEGIIKAAGTSNFKPAHLARLHTATGMLPQVNQINLNPWAQRADTVAYHRRHQILTESWSPIRPAALLSDPVILAVAKDHDATPAQVVLRWHTQHGYLPIPKSASPARQAENLASWDLELSEADMAVIDDLDRGEDQVTDSDVYGH
ncbi:MAG: aldo/keto reductase [Propionibacteriaceae bacterium]|jgi:2,5-diketo-D-gluconate reductase A|nr:aldo/keto reductase [Propionibacteriaceae bacterium]